MSRLTDNKKIPTSASLCAQLGKSRTIREANQASGVFKAHYA